MPFHPKDRNHHEREERLDALARVEFASASQRAIWNLAENLRAIDAAERIRARGWMTAMEHYQVSAALKGLTPDEARAAAQTRFALAYPDAVEAERLAA